MYSTTNIGFSVDSVLSFESKRLVVFAGNGPQDELWKSYSNDQLSDLDGIEYELVTDLTLDGFVDRAAALPPDTILLVLTI